MRLPLSLLRAARPRPLPTARPVRALATTAPRHNAARHAAASSTAKKQLLTLGEIDRLLKHIEGDSGVQKPQPMLMRAHPVPWMQSDLSPDLRPSDDRCAEAPLNASEEEELLRPRHMSESYTSFDLPLASDPKLYDRYVNTSGGFRMGKLLEHLDSLAGAVSYRHCLPANIYDGTSPAESFHHAAKRAGLYLATASADRLDMFGRLNHQNVRDLKFSGFVTWTGSSSMEVFVKMEGTRPSEPGKSETLMLGRFAMVCRDAVTHKARRVPPLIVETPEEKLLWDFGQEHKDSRVAFSQAALDKKPPSKEEAAEVHTLMMEVAKNNKELNGEKIVQMRDTEIESVQLMFPQDRNLHGKVFGGILMRMAFELCFTNAAIFAHEPMHFLSLDQITFRLPVPIGAVLRLTSKVIKTTPPLDGPDGEARAHIRVRAEVEEVETGLRRETNTFYFTMAKNDRKPIGRTVVPNTYKEAMEYLEGDRRLDIGEQVRKLYRAGGLEGNEGK
ncbi:hypothetical protein Q8F55_007870 [Vanrija albida]|uniref:HotDog ACOT-type domain-containing protein n=1 Tax=Vanrija albida TaxID=181172 RepID=A0ABR3PUS1_9TREE